MPAFVVNRSSSATKIIRKTADEAVNNSSTLQDDDELKFAIAVNEIWYVEAVLRCSGASTTADIKLGWTGPTGATAAWKNAGQLPVAVGSDPGNTNTMATTSSLGLRSGESPATGLSGYFFADSSHAGTIQLQWAQNTATVEDTKILANSFLRLTKLA